MNLIAGEVKTLLENHDYGFPTSVVRSFNSAQKVFPRIVVMQINDLTGLRSANKELLSVLVFQIEIYAKDTTDESGAVVSRVEVSDNIANQIDELIYNKYKMNRDGVTDDDSYAIDTARKILRYSCAIDYSGYTYRTI